MRENCSGRRKDARPSRGMLTGGVYQEFCRLSPQSRISGQLSGLNRRECFEGFMQRALKSFKPPIAFYQPGGAECVPILDCFNNNNNKKAFSLSSMKSFNTAQKHLCTHICACTSLFSGAPLSVTCISSCGCPGNRRKSEKFLFLHVFLPHVVALHLGLCGPGAQMPFRMHSGGFERRTRY